MQLEGPWQPDGPYLDALPSECQLLISPIGRYHLMLDDDGQWWHLHPDGSRTPGDAGRAAQLRPSECGLVIKLTLVWAWRTGAAAVDALADGVKQMVVSYALEAASLRRSGRTT